MLEQLKRCEEKMAAHMSLYRRYAEAVSSLRTVRMLEVDLERGELPLWIEVVCTDRDGLINHLAQMEIDARKATPCLNLSPHLATDRSFPRSRFFMDSILTLPSGPDQSPTGIDRTLEALAEFDTEVR
jgi:dTDP-4-amino-4,6-dideoxygalactose transaminase